MSRLQSLPTNIIRQIMETLCAVESRQHLPRYASVSRVFQSCIEAKTWKELDVRPDELEILRKQVTVARLKHLSVLRLHLPFTQFSSKKDKDAHEEQERGNITFTESIQSLWNILATWTKHGDGLPGILLEIHFDSGQAQQTLRERVSSTKSSKDVLFMELDLFEAESGNMDLKEVSVVTGLQFHGRHVMLRSVVTLLSRLPNLSVLDVELEHDTRNDNDIEARIDFARGLEKHGPQIQHVRLRRPKMSTSHHRSPREDFARSKFYDQFRNYSLRLYSLTFDDCIDARLLFSPFRTENSQNPESRSLLGTRLWNNLRYLSIRNSYLIGAPYTRVRNRIDAYGRLHDLMLTIGMAIRYMPALEYLKLRQIILDDSTLKNSKLVYQWRDGQPVLKISGVQPSVAVLQCWRSGVVQSRRGALRIEFDIEVTSTGEDLTTSP